MNMFAKFDENPAMTLQDIKETKCYGRTHTRTDGQRENGIPTTKFAGGIKKNKSKMEELEWSQDFPHYNPMGAICCHGNQSSDLILPKT